MNNIAPKKLKILIIALGPGVWAQIVQLWWFTCKDWYTFFFQSKDTDLDIHSPWVWNRTHDLDLISINRESLELRPPNYYLSLCHPPEALASPLRSSWFLEPKEKMVVFGTFSD